MQAAYSNKDLTVFFGTLQAVATWATVSDKKWPKQFQWEEGWQLTQKGLKFGRLKGLIKANLSTKIGRNPMNIHGVMTNYFRKIR